MSLSFVRRPFGPHLLLSLRLRVAAGALLAAGCAPIGQFIWVDQYAHTVSTDDDGYVVRAGDLLSVRVFNQDSLSNKVRVRSDGKVSLTFLNDVDAAGYTPSVLAQQLQTRLKDFINNPVVTVVVEESPPLTISVLGEIARPGLYPLGAGAGVLQALAAAGGTTEYARPDRLFVLRRSGGGPARVEFAYDEGARPGSFNLKGGNVVVPTVRTYRIRFTYEALARAEGEAAAFRLQPGDVVVVE